MESHIESSWSVEVSSSLNLVVMTNYILLDARLGSCWCWSTFTVSGPSCLHHNFEGPGPHVVLPVVSNLHLDGLTRLLLAILLEKLPIHKPVNYLQVQEKKRNDLPFNVKNTEIFTLVMLLLQNLCQNLGEAVPVIGLLSLPGAFDCEHFQLLVQWHFRSRPRSKILLDCSKSILYLNLL